MKLQILIFAAIALWINLSAAHEVPGSHDESQAEQTGHLKEIQVLGNYHSSSILDVVPSVSTLHGDKLLRRSKISLGETLKDEVGVNATSYGPSSSRPVIRGLDGDRIRILQNGIGVLDASGTSQDHAVPIDPLSAESIEIVRGPVTLLYGSSAVGGVINIVNTRIHEEFTEGFSGAADLQGQSVNSSQSVATKADYGTSQWMFHVDGNFNKSLDLKIPGFARTLSQRISDPQSPEPKDKIANSHSESQTAAFGTTYITQDGYMGVSVSSFQNHYGVISDPDVAIEMQQHRFDIAGQWAGFGPFEHIKLKSAQSLYMHQELETGSVETTFKNKGNETRLEFIQKKSDFQSGVLGLQLNTFEFSAIGDEAFVPGTKNLSAALFYFGELTFEKFKWNFGARGEHSRSKPEANANFTFTDAKSFFTTSVATGLLYNLSNTFSTALNLSYNERAPTYQELFSAGEHVATSLFEQGDTNLEKEKSVAAEISLRHQSASFTGVLNIFGQRFNDYIALSPRGGALSSPGVPFYDYLAQDADIYGVELDTHTPLKALFGGQLELTVKGDYLRGKNRKTGSNLPRMSPTRASIGLLHNVSSWTSDIEAQQVFKQTRISEEETPTDGYLQTNLGVSYKWQREKSQWTFYARMNNVFNVEARNHVSLLKDVSQVGGRNFTGGIRAYF